MNATQLLNIASSATNKCTDYDINHHGVFPYPYLDQVSKNVSFSVVSVYALSNRDDRRKHHNVIISYDGSDFSFWCGDTFLEGTNHTAGIVKDKAEKLIQDFQSNHCDHNASKEHLEDIIASVLHIYDTLTKSSGCNYWRNNKKGYRTCKHCDSVLALLGEEIVDSLTDEYLNLTTPSSKSFLSSKADNVDELLTHYLFKKHVLIQGEKGGGKTYTANSFIDSQNLNKCVLVGHSQMESIDMLGFSQVYNGSIVWNDGQLSRAFRNAMNGYKTCLLIDELLRIPARELNILVGSLSPDAQGCYSLNTGRMIDVDNGVGVSEILRAPAENLWIVATTNVGSEYEVEDMESALKDRFVIHQLESNIDDVAEIVALEVKNRGFKISLVDKLISFYQKVNDFVIQSLLGGKVNTRHLVEIVKFCNDETDIVNEIVRRKMAWVSVDFNGVIEQSHEEHLSKIVQSVFG